jgi:hypothetical protein
MKTIQTQVPEQIYKRAFDLVKQGRFHDGGLRIKRDLLPDQ